MLIGMNDWWKSMHVHQCISLVLVVYKYSSLLT